MSPTEVRHLVPNFSLSETSSLSSAVLVEIEGPQSGEGHSYALERGCGGNVFWWGQHFISYLVGRCIHQLAMG